MKKWIWIALITVYFVWGATYLAIRYVVESMPPFIAAGARFFLAGLLMYTFSRVSGTRGPTRNQWRSAFIIGLLLMVGGNGSVSWAEQKVPSGVASLIIATVPLWMVLIDIIRPSSQTPGIRSLVGIAIGFFGIFLLIGPANLLGNSRGIDAIGSAVLLVASISWASGSIYNREADLPESPLLGTGMAMICGGISLLLLGITSGEWGRLEISSITPQAWIGFLYLVIFGSLVAFVAYLWLLRVAPTSLVSTYAYVNPLVALALGTLIADEPLTARITISAIIVLFAVVLINCGD